MNKLSEWQLYCILVLLTMPVAFLEQPHRLIHIAYNNAWLTFFPVLLTGALLIKMYEIIINKSREPFPVMLEEHLGKIAGRILGSVYIFIFLLTCAFNLRVFLEFMKMMVLPMTPISVFIGVILLVGYMAIKTGLSGVARFSEFFIPIGLTFTMVLVLISLGGNFNLKNIYPIGYIGYKAYGMGVITATLILGKIMPVLSLAYFLADKKRVTGVMYKILFTYVPFLAFSSFAVVVTLGTYPSRNFVFPSFNMIRLAQVGTFLQNLDIFFVAVLIIGIVGAVTLSWWMACFITQKVFNLRNYRFVAAPTSLIIGIMALIISRNNLGVVIWSLKIMPLIFVIFFILLPLLVCIICMFKPDIPALEPADSTEMLHKQEVAG
ncbi:MAG TPA: GerAB/ArcD/ProY family transporter [Syntrophomonas sp.]|nr:GerAB/ArcD/ProY family transporter [Syntrophomonas sp.]